MMNVAYMTLVVPIFWKWSIEFEIISQILNIFTIIFHFFKILTFSFYFLRYYYFFKNILTNFHKNYFKVLRIYPNFVSNFFNKIWSKISESLSSFTIFLISSENFFKFSKNFLEIFDFLWKFFSKIVSKFPQDIGRRLQAYIMYKYWGRILAVVPLDR